MTQISTVALERWVELLNAGKKRPNRKENDQWTCPLVIFVVVLDFSFPLLTTWMQFRQAISNSACDIAFCRLPSHA